MKTIAKKSCFLENCVFPIFFMFFYENKDFRIFSLDAQVPVGRLGVSLLQKQSNGLPQGFVAFLMVASMF